MYLGTFDHTVDTKGRIAIPSQYREVLGDQGESALILSISPVSKDTCVVYPASTFQHIARRFTLDGPMDPRLVAYGRTLSTHSTRVVPDRNGRILIPTMLRELAGLTKEVTWVGMFDRMELWNRRKWAERLQADLGDVENLNRFYNELSSKTE